MRRLHRPFRRQRRPVLQYSRLSSSRPEDHHHRRAQRQPTGRERSKSLDRVDRRILDELQGDARVSNQERAKRVGLSPAPCWRRLRRLEEEGFINGYATLLNGPAVGLPILAYTLVSLENHHPETIREFDRLVQDRPEILECHSMSGPNDYLLRIVAASMEAYERFMSSHVLQIKAVRAVNTSFVLRTKKYTTRLPVV